MMWISIVSSFTLLPSSHPARGIVHTIDQQMFLLGRERHGSTSLCDYGWYPVTNVTDYPRQRTFLRVGNSTHEDRRHTTGSLSCMKEVFRKLTCCACFAHMPSILCNQREERSQGCINTKVRHPNDSFPEKGRTGVSQSFVVCYKLPGLTLAKLAYHAHLFQRPHLLTKCSGAGGNLQGRGMLT